jgi:hypothetical protein
MVAAIDNAIPSILKFASHNFSLHVTDPFIQRLRSTVPTGGINIVHTNTIAIGAIAAHTTRSQGGIVSFVDMVYMILWSVSENSR